MEKAAFLGCVFLPGQPLYELEFPIEGSAAYIGNDYAYRDAGFEEIFHMIHDLGIGTRYTTGVLQSTYREQIKAAKDVALANQIWPTEDSDEDVKSWIKELDTEGSLEQEYIASVIDSYYGYWGAYNESDGGMWGVYKAKTRNDIKQKDPLGYQLMKDFLPEFITYTARIDETFTGTFSLSFDKEQLYTYKSQYLLNARLLGNNSSNLVGNCSR